MKIVASHVVDKSMDTQWILNKAIDQLIRFLQSIKLHASIDSNKDIYDNKLIILRIFVHECILNPNMIEKN